MKTFALTLLAVTCACLLGLTSPGHPRAASATPQAVRAPATASRVDLRDEIARARSETWRWQRVVGAPTTPSRGVARSASASYQRWVLRLWTRRAIGSRRRAEHPPHATAFLCIHGYEGSWRAATGNGYYGGLQMDLAFQREWGRRLLRTKGTADHWTPLEQIWAAERAHRSGLGFSPWPNTGRYCGVL
jgi:hypothetical protein